MTLSRPRVGSRRWLLGAKLDPLDPRTRHSVVLVAFLAWIGLGADGLSSAVYGPAEAFLALGEHKHFALYLAATTAMTVFVIALAYNQVIDLFPSGGGGYKAATQLIGKHAGLVSGAALIVDYVLTIAISVASGIEAVFSLLPLDWLGAKVPTGLFAILVLVFLNLRGMKESIILLMPIFLGFFLSHAALIIYGIDAHSAAIGTLWPDTIAETRSLANDTGWFFVIALFLRAFSIGGGTYTGIEAVSNSVNMLAEPRARTGHWTMYYMAASLAFTAAGVIMLYLLWDAHEVPGQTLNAVVFRDVIASLGWSPLMVSAGVIAVLALEAGLLFVAANTGFIGGPAVLAAMASDRWVPRQFRQLSSRLVTQNGVVLMGGLALIILWATAGDVSMLVVLYSINVFVTFSLTLFGLCRHWWEQRKYRRDWKRAFALSALGFLVTGSILVVLLFEKFLDGGWVTLLITGAVIAVCLWIHRHYEETRKLTLRVDARFDPRCSFEDATPIEVDPTQPTAIVMVGSSRGIGVHTVKWIVEHFGAQRFKNFVFISVGEVDRDAFSSERSIKSLQALIDNSLHAFCGYANSLGYGAKAYSAFGADPLAELTTLTHKVLAEFPNSVCFAAKLVMNDDSLVTRLLHNQMPAAMQRRLNVEGKAMVLVPIRMEDNPGAAAGPVAPIH